MEINDDEADFILGACSLAEDCDNPENYDRAIASLKEKLSNYQWSQEERRYTRK